MLHKNIIDENRVTRLKIDGYKTRKKIERGSSTYTLQDLMKSKSMIKNRHHSTPAGDMYG